LNHSGFSVAIFEFAFAFRNPSTIVDGGKETEVGAFTMAIQAEEENPEERLVKSAERVRDLGEVFTAAATVREMLDLLPDEMWRPHPSPTFLEPACGDGWDLWGINTDDGLTSLTDFV
jgi:hypothetical protein